MASIVKLDNRKATGPIGNGKGTGWRAMPNLMTDSNTRAEETEGVTYGAMENALLQLGFSRDMVPATVLGAVGDGNAVVFRHTETDSLIFLREAPLSALVDPIDLMTARKTVVERGAATRDEFAAALNDGASRTHKMPSSPPRRSKAVVTSNT